VAHELSHIKNWDILLSTVVVVLVGFLSLLSNIFLRTMRFGGDGDRRGNAVFILLGVVLAVLAPIAGVLIQLAISRKREFLADASGALLSRYPEGLASALQKIGSYGKPMRRANHATAHLFIANPFRASADGEKIGFMTQLFMTHPPIEQRIAALRGEAPA
jgi:heat shock protein HtpX